MANSKDIRLKKFKIVFGWILGLAIIALSFWAYNIIGSSKGYAGGVTPNIAAESDLRTLKTCLEAYHADEHRYPQHHEMYSHCIEKLTDGVTASWITSDDKKLFFAISFSKEGDKIFLTTSETHNIYWIGIPAQGLVPPNI